MLKRQIACIAEGTHRKQSIRVFLLTFNFISPRRKCFGFTLNSRPSVEVSKPSRPVIIGSYAFNKFVSTGSPLMNQFKCVIGLERPDVQLTCTKSLIW